MNELMGRKVKLIVDGVTISGNKYQQDGHEVGSALRIVAVLDPEKNQWPVICHNNLGFERYKPEQLRYLNNKPVIIPPHPTETNK